MRKTIFISVIFLLCFSVSTCKKISKYPFDMYGLWVSNEGGCCGCGYMVVEIKRNGDGIYGTYSQYIGCDGKLWSGKVRFTSDHLYIGDVKLKFLQKPQESSSNDSIGWHWPTQNYKISATMKVRMSFLHHNDEYTFNKIKKLLSAAYGLINKTDGIFSSSWSTFFENA